MNYNKNDDEPTRFARWAYAAGMIETIKRQSTKKNNTDRSDIEFDDWYKRAKDHRTKIIKNEQPN